MNMVTRLQGYYTHRCSLEDASLCVLVEMQQTGKWAWESRAPLVTTSEKPTVSRPLSFQTTKSNQTFTPLRNLLKHRIYYINQIPS